MDPYTPPTAPPPSRPLIERLIPDQLSPYSELIAWLGVAYSASMLCVDPHNEVQWACLIFQVFGQLTIAAIRVHRRGTP